MSVKSKGATVEEGTVSISADKEETVEAEEVPPAKRGGGAWKGAVAAALVVLLLLALYINMANAPKEPTGVQMTVRRTDTGITLNLVATSDGGGGVREGTATVTITYGTNQTARTTLKVGSNGFGSTTIPFTDFVMGNGPHEVSVTYFNLKRTETLQVTGAVEDLLVSVKVLTDTSGEALYTGGKARFAISVTGVDAAGKYLDTTRMAATIRELSIVNESGSALSPPNIPAGLGQSTLGQYNATIPYDRSGNYTIRARVTNNLLKSSSPLASFNYTATVPLNSNPLAEAGPDQEFHKVFGLKEVKLDGSASLNDGPILYYKWDFGDGTATDWLMTPVAFHNFTSGKTYSLTLTVLGDAPVPGAADPSKLAEYYELDTDTMTVTVSTL